MRTIARVVIPVGLRGARRQEVRQDIVTVEWSERDEVEDHQEEIHLHEQGEKYLGPRL